MTEIQHQILEKYRKWLSIDIVRKKIISLDSEVYHLEDYLENYSKSTVSQLILSRLGSSLYTQSGLRSLVEQL